MNERWENEAKFYKDLLITSCEEVHFGVGIPGNNDLRLIKAADLGQSALDLGCGSGENLLALSRLGYAVTGIEPSARQLEYAANLLNAHGVDATLLEISAERAGEISASFDLALSVGALHFCKDIAKVLQSVSKILKPGGTLVLSMPHPIDMLSDFEVTNGVLVSHMSSYFPSGQEIQGSRYWAKFGGNQPTGFKFNEYVYTISGLVKALIEAGFRIRALHEPECLHRAEYPCLFKKPDATFLTLYCTNIPQYIILVADLELGENDPGERT